MDMALSTGGLGFAWSRALGNNLRGDYDTIVLLAHLNSMITDWHAVLTNCHHILFRQNLNIVGSRANVEFKGSTKRLKMVELSS